MAWECDPAGVLPAEPRPALGLFNHEAVAVDPLGKRLYLTEDKPDGRLYRFTPTAYPDLRTGVLEAAVVSGESGELGRGARPGRGGRHAHPRAGAPEHGVQRR